MYGLRSSLLVAVILLFLTVFARGEGTPQTERSGASLFADDNLTAWLVMFTDKISRTPEKRAAMVEKLGFKRVGFEAFEKYIPILNEQMDAYERHGIQVTSVYFLIKTEKPSEEESVQRILETLKRRKATPELWVMFPRGAFDKASQEKRLESMITAFSDMARAAKDAGCRMGLYNYGSWFGDVDMQLAIIKGVRERTEIEIGTVFNFHRGHQHMEDFAIAIRRMQPHLMAVNLNGMKQVDAGKTGGSALILPVGEGDAELSMMQELVDCGYQGPIGLIDHQSGVDAEIQLKANLAGLKQLRTQIKPPATSSHKDK